MDNSTLKSKMIFFKKCQFWGNYLTNKRKSALKVTRWFKPKKKKQMLDGLKVVNLHAFCFIFDMEDNKLCLP